VLDLLVLGQLVPLLIVVLPHLRLLHRLLPLPLVLLLQVLLQLQELLLDLLLAVLGDLLDHSKTVGRLLQGSALLGTCRRAVSGCHIHRLDLASAVTRAHLGR
jgi:hypothetical protein